VDAVAFAKFLQGAEAQAIFREQGFTVLVPAAN
jgi:ABC-type molybdate transport system substrate-binding protein